MGVVNFPPNLYQMFTDIQNRLTKLENAGRFTLPNVATDPTAPRNGDLWLNTTGNTPKYVNALGVVTNLGGGAASPFGPRLFKTGHSYGTIVPGTMTSSTLPSNNVLYASPIYVPNTISATSLSMFVNVLAGTSGGYSFGIYSNSATDDYPNAKLRESFIPTDTTFGATGWNQNVITPLSMTPGLYWLVAVRQATTAPTVLCLNSTITGDTAMPFASALGNTTPPVAFQQTGVTGTLPNTFTASQTLVSGTVPFVLVGF